MVKRINFKPIMKLKINTTKRPHSSPSFLGNGKKNELASINPHVKSGYSSRVYRSKVFINILTLGSRRKCTQSVNWCTGRFGVSVRNHSNNKWNSNWNKLQKSNNNANGVKKTQINMLLDGITKLDEFNENKKIIKKRSKKREKKKFFDIRKESKSRNERKGKKRFRERSKKNDNDSLIIDDLPKSKFKIVSSFRNPITGRSFNNNSNLKKTKKIKQKGSITREDNNSVIIIQKKKKKQNKLNKKERRKRKRNTNNILRLRESIFFSSAMNILKGKKKKILPISMDPFRVTQVGSR